MLIYLQVSRHFCLYNFNHNTKNTLVIHKLPNFPKINYQKPW